MNTTNAAVPTVGDSEFEEPQGNKTGAPQKTPEQIAQEEAATKSDTSDDSHLLDDVRI
jgi:hypothetical protein